MQKWKRSNGGGCRRSIEVKCLLVLSLSKFDRLSWREGGFFEFPAKKALRAVSVSVGLLNEEGHERKEETVEGGAVTEEHSEGGNVKAEM
jgi:hypothetical protein